MNDRSVLVVSSLCLLLGACGSGETWIANGDANGVGGPDAGADAPRPTTDGGRTSDGIQGCDPRTFTLAQAPPPELYLALDRSGSMAEPGAAPPATKWQELQAAVDFVLGQFESSIRFGLLVYPVNDSCGVSGPQVPVAIDNRQAVLSHLTASQPAGGTPTAAALNNAAKSLHDIGAPDSSKFIVLATDGGPNCNYLLSADPACSCTLAASEYCCTNHPDLCLAAQTCLDDLHTLQVIRSLRTNHQITTFIIGLEGSAQYENLLNEMAKAGGAPQASGGTSYYPASNNAELQAALQSIAVAVISCEIDLESRPDFPDKVLVYLDGQLVPRDPGGTNGWDYADDSLTRIQLFGEACSVLQDGEKHALTATFACVVN